MAVSDVLCDPALREAFHAHLNSCLMSEILDLYISLEDFFHLDDPDMKLLAYKKMAEEFFLPNSPGLVNHSFNILAQLREVYEEVSKRTISELPGGLLEPVRIATLDLLAYSCLPPFIMSDIYQDFQEEVLDSTKVGLSRQKAERFFGEKIEVCGIFFFFLAKMKNFRDSLCVNSET
jgi:Regulator of G protein signaling domain